MGAQTTTRRPFSARDKAGRLIPLAAALLLAALLAVPSSGIVMAQGPGIVLVNAEREFVERKKEGEFVARPVFDRKIETLYYAVRDADTGDWISAMYRVVGGEKQRADGWEYSFEYPALDEQPANSTRTAPTCWRCSPSQRGESGRRSTPSCPSTSRPGSGTGCWPP